ETTGEAKSRENLMVRGKYSKLSNRNQDYLALSETNSSTKANTRYPNTPEKQDLDLKTNFMMRMMMKKKMEYF
ncbi:hypothetical protein, partial [Streptococcus anginosus]|uniref:hypothetical protein n=1 Tax=Streptococcus anginosus TaxID=1328 RepID=UPI002ED9929D